MVVWKGGEPTPFRQYGEVIKLARQPAEKRLVLSGLATVAHRQALQWAVEFLADTSVRPEAEQAVLSLARRLGPADRPIVNTALQRVIATTANTARRTEAQELLRAPVPRDRCAREEAGGPRAAPRLRP